MRRAWPIKQTQFKWLMAALMIGFPISPIWDYLAIATLKREGTQGAIHFSAMTHNSRSKRSYTTYYYNASIESIPVHVKIKTSESEKPSVGATHPVIFSEQSLHRYTFTPEVNFEDWIFGTKGESNFILFLLNFGVHQAVIFTFAEALWIYGFYRSLSRKDKK